MKSEENRTLREVTLKISKGTKPNIEITKVTEVYNTIL